MDQEVIRKGPWTDNEDSQLGFYVNLFGDRRWDFIAKVSGLKRTGKSCRLRWVNYLHPGLRRGKMTPHEERLVLDLHANWGNRWSRIARKLPGRTDNEIKNYWRTHMRKKAQEMKQSSSPHSSSSYTSSSSSSSSINSMPMVGTNDKSFYDNDFTPFSLVSNNSCNSTFNSIPFIDSKETKYYDMGGLEVLIPKEKDNEEEKREKPISMDDIWKDIEHSQSQDFQNLSSEIMISPIWNHYPDSLWVPKEDNKMTELVFPPITDHFLSFYGLEGTI